MALDPRGPVRKIVAVDWRTDVCLVTMDCGHTGRRNQIFTYKIGADSRCFQCGQEQERKSRSKDRRIGESTMEHTLDRTPRYAPSYVIIARRMKLFPVQSYIAHPPGAHPPKCPIVSSMTALELVTEAGSRWFGCEKAYINSELRMVVVGTPARDEVRMKWEVCKRP